MGKYRFIAIDVDGTLLDDNDKFDVNRLNKDIHYTYAWKYEKKPADEKEEKKLSEKHSKGKKSKNDT